MLDDPELAVGLGGHLRQVGDAKHLGAPAQFSELPSHYFGNAAADARVHLVKHTAPGHPGRGGHLYGKSNARQFAAGSHIGEALQGLAGIGADQKFDVIAALRAKFRLTAGDARGESTARHPQGLHELGDLPAESLGRPRSCRAQQVRRCVVIRRQQLQLSFPLRQAQFCSLERLQFLFGAPQLGGQFDHG